MVMRYAKSEKELLDMKKEKTTLMKQIKDQQKENENILSKLRLLSEDKSRLAVNLDNKVILYLKWLVIEYLSIL